MTDSFIADMRRFITEYRIWRPTVVTPDKLTLWGLFVYVNKEWLFTTST